MTSYIDVPTVTDPDELAAAAFVYLQAQYPGWAPNNGNLETILIEALARMVAETRDVASSVPTSIFRYYGASILGLLPLEDAPASGATTWTAKDTAGYTVESGFLIGIRAAGDQLIPFEAVNTVVIPPGSVSTAIGEVVIRALSSGSDSNALSGNAELIDSLDWVSTIVVAGATSGGVSAEEDSVYLSRLVTEIQLFSPRPILPADFAVLARTIPGVYRALAIDGYNPAGPSFNVERMVSVALADELGDPVSALVKGQVDALLQAEREVTFVVNIIDPTYSYVDVSVQFVSLAGYSPADVGAEIVSSLGGYLSPDKWGSSSGDNKNWVSQPTVRYLEIATVINSVPGVDYIQSLTMGVNPSILVSSDIVLSGVAALTRPNNITALGT